MTRQLSAGPHLITTSPSLTTCWRCKRPVMAATVGGLDFRIDTACLNRLGEFDALVRNLATFELHGEILVRRYGEKISGPWPAYPVMAEHACKPIPAAHTDPAWEQAAAALIVMALGGTVVKRNDGEHPPF